MGQKLFVPFSEALLDEIGVLSSELVPYHIEYKCVRLREQGEEVLVLDSEIDDEACIALEV